MSTTKKCLAFKKTSSGLRCSRYAPESGPEHAVSVLPDLGEYGVFNYEVNSSDVLVGALIGLAGVGAAKLASSKLALSLPGIVVSAFPLIGASIGGVAAFMLQKNSNPNRGKGHMVGAITVGAGVTAMDVLRTSPSTQEYFSDVVTMRLGRYGVLTRDPSRIRRQMAGVMVRDPSYSPGQARTMAALGAMSMNDAETSGLEELMN